MTHLMLSLGKKLTASMSNMHLNVLKVKLESLYRFDVLFH